MKKQSILMFLCLLLFGLAARAGADIFMKQKQHTDGFSIMGQEQPAKDEIVSTWIANDKVRSDGQDQSVIIRMDKGVMYILNHAKKTYVEMPTDMSQMAKSMMPEADAEKVKQMQNMMQIKVSVQTTGESKRISQWGCTKYIQTIESMMGPMTSEVWATEEIKVDKEAYARYTSAMFAQIPGMQGAIETLQNEMQKIKGVAVLTMTSSTVMGQTIKSQTELVEVKEGKAPAGIYDLPGGYKKTSMGAK